MTIPVLDLSPLRSGEAPELEALAREVDRACSEVGFFVTVGHGVDPALVASLRHDALAFFDLDQGTKSRYEADAGTDYAGYVRSEALSYSAGTASPPDLKESFTMHPPDRRISAEPNPWPVEVPSFEATVTTYFRAMEALAEKVMEVFALALGLDQAYFTPMIDQSLSAVRMLHYPELTSPPEPGQLRAGTHTDFGSLTLLLTDDAPGGLQVRSRDQGWIDVAHIPGAYVVNIGDLMARWTNDRWVSTEHRVVVPPLGAGTRRLSVAFFHQPNDDAVIEAIPTCVDAGEQPHHEPVRSGEHLRLKIRRQREMKA